MFGKKETCCLCNQQEGSKKLSNGYICKGCIVKCYPFIITGSWKDISSDKAMEALEASEDNAQKLQIFQPTKKIEKYVSFDENNQLWKVTQPNVVFKYEDVISYELLEDGESITSGGLGRALVGGVLLGGTGAVVGGITGRKKTKREINEFKIKIVTRNKWFSEVNINLLSGFSVKTGSMLYNGYKESAQKILSEFTVITDSFNVQEKKTTVSEADEILKYKKLWDDGIITKEEFEAKKKQLLGIE